MSSNQIKALALLSGGLDSTLAAMVMKRHGIEVMGLIFVTPFSSSEIDLEEVGEKKKEYYESLGIHVEIIAMVDEYIEMVKHPKFGYGKNLNPCLDCKIFFLKKAKELLGLYGASFIITGEVLDQRPMSQHHKALINIEREAGVEGLVVRPLSGKLLPPTKAEIDGLIKREWLLDISGRGRKEQIRLAEEFGLKEFQQPAGGCLLTVPDFSNRLKKLIQRGEFDPFHISVVKIGRHFFVNGIRLVVGRNESENNNLKKLGLGVFTILEPVNTTGPTGLLEIVDPDAELLLTSLKIIGRYCDNKKDIIFDVIYSDRTVKKFQVEEPFSSAEVDTYRG